jgi:hypothetical protein
MDSIKIVEQVATNGGATVKINSGESPKTGYVVATKSKWGWIVPATNFNAETIEQYATTNARHLNGVRRYLGAWENQGLVYLDVVEIYKRKANAIRHGVEKDQIAVWDIVNGCEIMTGGTGQVE